MKRRRWTKIIASCLTPFTISWLIERVTFRLSDLIQSQLFRDTQNIAIVNPDGIKRCLISKITLYTASFAKLYFLD